MFQVLGDNPIQEYDAAVLESAIKQCVARRPLATLETFANSIGWTLNQLNKHLDGNTKLKATDRKLILDGIRQWAPELDIYQWTIRTLLGEPNLILKLVSAAAQLSMFIMFLAGT